MGGRHIILLGLVHKKHFKKVNVFKTIYLMAFVYCLESIALSSNLNKLPTQHQALNEKFMGQAASAATKQHIRLEFKLQLM